MIDEILTNLQTWFIENVDGYTTDNCSIGDEAIFSYVQTTSDPVYKVLMLEYDGFNDTGRNEYKNTVIQWRVAINPFFLISGDEYIDALERSREFVSEVVSKISRTNLYGTVHSVKVLGGEPPLTYERVNFYYILTPITIAVLESVN